MALFYDCWQARGATLQRLHLLLEYAISLCAMVSWSLCAKQLLVSSDAAANAEREAQAAIDIQRLFRGQRVRATVTQQTYVCSRGSLLC